MLILFLLAFVLAWLISIIVWRSNRASLTNRWLAAVFAIAGLGPFNYFFGDLLLPEASRVIPIGERLYADIYWASCVLSAIAHYFSPYCFLMFGFAYSDLFNRMSLAWRRIVYVLGLIPVAVMYASIPLYPHEPVHYIYLCMWVVPYVFASGVMMTVSCFSSKLATGNHLHVLLWVLTLPLALVGLYTEYVTRALGDSNTFKVTVVIPIIVFVSMIVFLYRYGLWGIKIRLDRHIMNGSIREINMGTQMVIHAFKNELVKVSMGLANAQNQIGRSGDTSAIRKDFEIMNASIENIYDIIRKIRNQTIEIELNERIIDLRDSIDRAISGNAALLGAKNVTCENRIPESAGVIFDPFHLGEMLTNIIRNSFEAMENSGRIEFAYAANGILRISDNGKGIPPGDLRSVLKPFFSTKRDTHSFGLGLTYCYCVMREHGGRIDIYSETGTGTTVAIKFARPKVVRTTGNREQGSMTESIPHGMKAEKSPR